MAKATTTWGAGDYPRMAVELESASVAAVASVPIRTGLRVLDVAAGTGNASLMAAKKGAVVTGVDIEPVLIEIAKERATRAGLDVRWLIGDCEELPVPDASVDVVFSIFGVMYASDHLAAACELDRVTAHGGRVVLASWQPGSVMPAMGQVLSPFLPPPPPSSGPPSRWGDAETLGEILQPTNLNLEGTTNGQVTLSFSDASEGASFLIATAGHVMSERDRLKGLGAWEALHEELAQFVEERCELGASGITLSLDYLIATAL